MGLGSTGFTLAVADTPPVAPPVFAFADWPVFASADCPASVFVATALFGINSNGLFR